MRLRRMLTLLWAMFTLTGCRPRVPVPEPLMPPNTIPLSGMMRELSAQPGFIEAVLQQLEGAKQHAGKHGPALLTPKLIDELRKRVLGKNWQGLDRFPGWTMREINPTVRLADRIVSKQQGGGDTQQGGIAPRLEGISAVHPGAPAPARDDTEARTFLDLGPYALGTAQTVSLDRPSPLPPFTTAGIVTRITPDITRGDGPNALAPEHAESQRLADVFNRLSTNQLNNAQSFAATLGGHTARTPEDLIMALTATGHTVSVTDSRYFANFGHLHYKGMDVMMPFWVNTEIAIPHSGGLFHRPRPLLVPVSHAEYEWHIRAPKGKGGLNADVSHYFGVDGKAEWRTMDTLDQAWVLRRDAHTYTGPQAIEVTRLLGLITLAYMHQHARRPTLPFGGYYTLGVCQDPVSAVEKKLTGQSTLFPNTADSAFFDDPRDPEVNALMRAIPKDRTGAPPEPARVFGSLPADPGVGARFATLTIPGLGNDLTVCYTAWQQGRLRRTPDRLFSVAGSVLLLGTLGTACALWLRSRSPSRRQ